MHSLLLLKLCLWIFYAQILTPVLWFGSKEISCCEKIKENGKYGTYSLPKCVLSLSQQCAFSLYRFYQNTHIYLCVLLQFITFHYETLFKLHTINFRLLKNRNVCLEVNNITHLFFLSFFNISISCSILKKTLSVMNHFRSMKEY